MIKEDKQKKGRLLRTLLEGVKLSGKGTYLGQKACRCRESRTQRFSLKEDGHIKATVAEALEE